MSGVIEGAQSPCLKFVIVYFILTSPWATSLGACPGP
jgi:hypothetical protein